MHVNACRFLVFLIIHEGSLTAQSMEVDKYINIMNTNHMYRMLNANVHCQKEIQY